MWKKSDFGPCWSAFWRDFDTIFVPALATCVQCKSILRSEIATYFAHISSYRFWATLWYGIWVWYATVKLNTLVILTFELELGYIRGYLESSLAWKNFQLYQPQIFVLRKLFRVIKKQISSRDSDVVQTSLEVYWAVNLGIFHKISKALFTVIEP